MLDMSRPSQYKSLLRELMVKPYPALPEQERSQQSRRLSRILEREKPFGALTVSPDEAVPVESTAPSPCYNALQALIVYHDTLRLVAYDLNTSPNAQTALCDPAIRVWPNALRWAVFFHSHLQLGNIARDCQLRTRVGHARHVQHDCNIWQLQQGPPACARRRRSGAAANGPVALATTSSMPLARRRTGRCKRSKATSSS